MNKFNKKMESFFEIEESNQESQNKNIQKIEFENFETDLKNDYEKARENLNELVEKGKIALDDILSIAKETERGRDFEVAAILIKTLVDVNEKSILLHKQMREITNYKAEKQAQTINNTLFVGSTAELSKMLKNLNTQEIEVN